MSKKDNQQVPPGNATKSRMLQLDILRGSAILLVIGHHYDSPSFPPGHLRWLTVGLWRFGWTGVDLFFVLSGFLVGGLLIKELHTRSSLDIKRFLVRRMFRIWPSYYLYLTWLLIL